MDDKILTQQIKNLKTRNYIFMGLAGAAFIAACIFASLWSNASVKTKNDKPQNAVMSASLDSLDNASADVSFTIKEEQYIKTIDSLKNVLIQLETAEDENMSEEDASVSGTYTDYIAQMLDNAKRFAGSDCNKSLAFLYAAKKVAKMEDRSGPNVDAIKVMIAKCEETLFGTNPGSSK